jgi:hypothetical protein
MPPISAPTDQGHADTPLRELWLPVTVQVAWTLVKRGYTVTPALLKDAREHLLRGIDPTLPVDAVEWMAEAWTNDYLARRVEQKYVAPPAAGPEVRVPAARWREELFEGADRGMEAVLRFVYAEGLTLDKASRQLRCRQSALVAAQKRLREHVLDRLEQFDGWTGTIDDRAADLILRRLAAMAAPGSPGPLGLMSPTGLAHAETCPRTSRAVRLIRKGHLTPNALFAPRDTQHPASGTVTVVGLHLHPDAHRHARGLAPVLAERAVQAGPGTWLLPVDAEADLYEHLVELCHKGRPARHHVRATRLEGSGRWAGQTLLGPVAIAAIDATRAVPWGDICGRPPLPLPAPPPPSSRTWWAAALLTAAATISLGITIAQPETVESATPIEARFHSIPDGWEVHFDVPDSAILDVVTIEDRELRILHRSMHSARGAWATGYGDFRARVPGEQVAFVASPKGLTDLERLVLDASKHPDPLLALEQTVQSLHPRSDFVRSTPAVVTASVAGPVVSPL